LNELPCPLLVTTKEGVVIEANAEFMRMVGIASETSKTAREKLADPAQSPDSAAEPCMTKENLIGAQLESLLPPASKIFMQTHVWPMLLRSGRVNEIYLKFNGVGDRRIPVLANCKLVANEGVERYYWVFMVALERSRFEEELLKARKRSEVTNLALVKSERFVKAITDALPGLVAYWDKDLFCHFANEPFKEWYGVSPAIGQHLRSFMGDEAFERGLPNIKAVLVTGEPQSFERVVVTPQGDTRYAFVNFIPDINASNEIVGFFVLATDITSLKNAQADLKLSASVFQNTIESIMVTDADGVILSVNPAFTKMTGYSMEETIGQTPRILKSDYHDDNFYSKLWGALAQDGRWEGETWNRHKSGELFLTWQSITVIQG
ncbi:MAG: PAS domain S-box protein, partial [Moraxellaceae bacterium]